MAQLKEGVCWKCGERLGALDYGRADTCRACGWDSRACKNCEFFDLPSNNQCRESQADRVVEKERSNFCDYFSPNASGPNGGGGSGTSARDAMKAAAEALFRKK